MAWFKVNRIYVTELLVLLLLAMVYHGFIDSLWQLTFSALKYAHRVIATVVAIVDKLHKLTYMVI